MSAILEQVTSKFGGTIPATAERIIETMAAHKSLGNVTQDQVQRVFPECSDGFFAAVRKELIEQRNANIIKPGSAQVAREDRILKTRNSSGKTVARKW